MYSIDNESKSFPVRLFDLQLCRILIGRRMKILILTKTKTICSIRFTPVDRIRFLSDTHNIRVVQKEC